AAVRTFPFETKSAVLTQGKLFNRESDLQLDYVRAFPNILARAIVLPNDRAISFPSLQATVRCFVIAEEPPQASAAFSVDREHHRSLRFRTLPQLLRVRIRDRIRLIAEVPLPRNELVPMGIDVQTVLGRNIGNDVAPALAR